MADSSAQQTYPTPKGILLVIGGHENKGDLPGTTPENKKIIGMRVLEAFSRLIKSDNPRIEIITSASNIGDEYYVDYKRAFGLLGITEVGHIHHDNAEEALNTPYLDRLQAADGVFFSGGNQQKLANTYQGSAFIKLLKDRYANERFLIGGTSAGAMVMSTHMIYESFVATPEPHSEADIVPGLAFLHKVSVDTHFTARGRIVRMSKLIAANPSFLGMGIDEDTSVMIEDGKRAEVIGSGIVFLIDGKHSTMDATSSIKNLKVSLLCDGEKFLLHDD